MFGTSFPEPNNSISTPTTVDQARTIVAPLYDALNQPGKKDVNALLEKAVNPDYKSYHTNEDWLSRDQLAEGFKNMGKISLTYGGQSRIFRC